MGEESSSRIKASPSRRNAPAATGISALAISPNTAAGRTALASDRVERHGARRLRWVERGALRAQPLDDLAASSSTRQNWPNSKVFRWRSQSRRCRHCHPMIPIMLPHRTGNDPPIQRFQKTGKCATRKRHGKAAPEPCLATRFLAAKRPAVCYAL